MTTLMKSTFLATLAVAMQCGDRTAGAYAQTQVPPPPERKIFAHYMGCYPVAAGAAEYHRRADAHKVRHDGEGRMDPYGDRWRNWPLVPDGMRLSLEESADLEIRRALRAGIDGFAVDAWAGGENAKKVFEALITVAGKNDYPFELTICYDPHCPHPRTGKPSTDFEKGMLEFLETYGDHPKLARRDGKVLIFGYHSIWPSVFGVERADEVEHNEYWRSAEFRLDPANWRRYREIYDRIEQQFGEEIYWQFDVGPFFYTRHFRLPQGFDRSATLLEAAKTMADLFPAIQGNFLAHADGGSPEHDRMAAAVRERGAEWSQPMNFQYANLMGSNRIRNGTDMLRRAWADARENDSTLIQFVTWNDYTENTMLAPGYETRYAIMDLNRHFIDWWKTGEEPTSEHDKIYLIYRKYPEGATFHPFKAKHRDSGGVIEVLTLLPKPARLRLVGRDAEWDAPAGMSTRQFPITPGPVIAELVRDGNVTTRLESPEPITDRPFREQNGMTAFSTEFERHWRADFGDDVEPLLRGEYADDDGDGLPNWFEMYWFGKFLDWSTATVADPDTDFDGDGRTNLQEYLDRTDPTTPDSKDAPATQNINAD